MPEEQKSWTVIKLLSWSTEFLKNKGVENPRLCVEWLLCEVLKFDRVQLYLHFDRPLVLDELASFKKLLLRRADREPLQYILGFTEFYSLKFFVKKGVLIPRPETELLVEKTLALCSDIDGEIRVLDIGAGSGNISIALAKNNPQIRVTAVDISPEAIAVARENAAYHEVLDKIEFIQGDIGDNSFVGQLIQPFDIIVSNPPYIANSEKPDLEPEVVNFEPEIALFCEDSLKFYKIIAQLTERVLKKSGHLICEIGSEQGEQVTGIFTIQTFQDVTVVPDLTGRNRFVYAKK
ncbi:MAG: peptide chain release factor N(5)-glutamine methyltransferase [Calditrichaeota bacterium]|nr:MAG: peptide chain release factor N(5)-glutamine methyltransferase [Calditrichota bacterium]